ncbi:BglG family transcription antiterminator [Halanaerobaculum tunisiense]
MSKLPNKRSGEILSILLNKDNPIIIKELAKQCNVSARTIRSDLKKLKEWLSNWKVDLIKKPRVGVWLEGSSLEKTKLEQVLFKTLDYKDSLSPKQRQQYILKSLLQENNKHTVDSLANKLYVSETTIYKDLKEISKWLKKYNLLLNKDYEINVTGKEKDLRKAVADLLAQLKNSQELKKMLEEVDEVEPESRIDKETYQQLRNLFGEIGFRKIEEVLDKTEEKLDFLFTDEAFVGLVIHIAISLERLKKDKDIVMEEAQLDKLKKKEEFEVAEFIVKELEENLDFEIPQAEIGYISLHVLGSKLQQNVGSTNITDILRNGDSKIIEITNDIITTAEEVLNVDLSHDEELLVGLALHLRPAINRMKYGMSLRNPLLDRIKNNYPSIFGAAWATSVVFENHLGIKVKEEEIGYIALHLGAALERINNKNRVIIVCGSGIGTSQLAATKLKNQLAGIEIVDIVSAHKLKKRNLEDIELIISTVPLKKQAEKVVKISPLVTQNDIDLIKNEINYIEEYNQKQSLLNENINELFDENLIFINLDLDSKEEIIKYLSNKLLKKNKVTDGFIDSVLEREDFTSTKMANNIAIPHGTEEDHILSSAIAVATLSNSVDWGNGSVDAVFLLALKREKGKRFFKHFHLVLENQRLLNKIKRANTKQDVIQTILNKN